MKQSQINLDIKSLLKILLSRDYKYFSNGILNSDGRRLFEKIIKLLMQLNPKYKKRIKKLRKNPTIENIRNFAKDILETL